MQDEEANSGDQIIVVQKTVSGVMSQDYTTERPAAGQPGAIDKAGSAVQFPNGNRHDASLRALPEPPANLQLTVAGYVRELKIAAVGGNGAAAFQLPDLIASWEYAWRDKAR